MSASQRRLWNTFNGTPASFAAATSSRPPSASGAVSSQIRHRTVAAISSRTRAGTDMIDAQYPMYHGVSQLVLT